MAQNYTDDCFGSSHVGQTDLQNMENNFACLKSSFSGTSAPSNPVAGMLWYDTTNNLLKLRNAANNAWLEIYDFANDRTVLKTSHLVDGVLSADAAGRAKMADGYVVTAKIGDGQVTSAKIPDGEITGAKLAAATITGNKLQGVTAGTNVIFGSAPTARTTKSTSYTKVKEIQIRRTGSIRVSFDLNCAVATTYYSYGRVYINNSPVGTERSKYNDTTPTTYTEDLSVSYGDLVQIYVRSSSAGGGAVVSSFRIRGNDLTDAVVNQD